jgi:hypothetical protein
LARRPTAENVGEAIRAAVDIPYSDGEPVVRMRLVSPTFLVAFWKLPGAQWVRRAERTERLRAAGLVDETLLAELVARYDLCTDDRRWTGKADWHASQRAQSPAQKIALIIKLQQREVELDRIRQAAGRPVRGIRPWRTRP